MNNKIVSTFDAKSPFRRLYKLSLIVIGIVIILSTMFVINKIKAQENLGQLINETGKQRMLSQRIIKSALGMEVATSSSQFSKYYKELEFSTNLIRNTQNEMENNGVIRMLKGANSEPVIDLITPYYDEIMRFADQILTSNEKLSPEDCDLLELNGEYYLEYMDELVALLSKYSTESSRGITDLVILLLAIVLGLLFGVYLLIFKPADLQIAMAIEETKKLFDIAPTAIIIVDPKDLTIQEINDAGEALLQINYEEALRMNIQDFISEETQKQIQHFSEREHEYILKGVEADVRDLNRNEIVALMSIGKFNFGGREHLLIGLADITSQKETEEVFEKLATIDEMTGLFNRRTGLVMIGKEFEKAKRHIYDVTICFIDMDGLKHVNDTFGHSEGDWYIRAVTTVIKEGIRQGDIGMRFGGDEIVLGLINCDQAEAEQIMARIQKVLDLIIAKEKKPYEMGISYGFSEYKKDVPISVEAFINFADERMYAVKTMKKSTRR